MAARPRILKSLWIIDSVDANARVIVSPFTTLSPYHLVRAFELQSNLPMRFGVVVFPGSNRDHDAWFAVTKILGQEAEFIWHDSTSLGNVDALVLPGGFSYGDYLRCGAIAKFSPVMQSVRKFAADGGMVLGICNGFQILVE